MRCLFAALQAYFLFHSLIVCVGCRVLDVYIYSLGFSTLDNELAYGLKGIMETCTMSPYSSKP